MKSGLPRDRGWTRGRPDFDDEIGGDSNSCTFKHECIPINMRIESIDSSKMRNEETIKGILDLSNREMFNDTDLMITYRGALGQFTLRKSGFEFQVYIGQT